MTGAGTASHSPTHQARSGRIRCNFGPAWRAACHSACHAGRQQQPHWRTYREPDSARLANAPHGPSAGRTRAASSGLFFGGAVSSSRQIRAWW